MIVVSVIVLSLLQPHSTFALHKFSLQTMTQTFKIQNLLRFCLFFSGTKNLIVPEFVTTAFRQKLNCIAYFQDEANTRLRAVKEFVW